MLIKKLCLFKTNTTKDYYKQTCVNSVYRGGKEPRTLKTYKEKQKKQPEGNIVKDARNLFIQKKRK